MWTCLEHAVHGWNGGIGIAPADLVRFFEQMGYDPDKLDLEGITPPNQIPRARDLPPESIHAAYDRFLDELSHGTDQPHITARRRFVDRVRRLPERTTETSVRAFATRLAPGPARDPAAPPP